MSDSELELSKETDARLRQERETSSILRDNYREIKSCLEDSEKRRKELKKENARLKEELDKARKVIDTHDSRT